MLTGCCVFVQSVNGAGGQGEGHDGGPQRPAHQEETLLQVKCARELDTKMLLGLQTQNKIVFLDRELFISRPGCLL